MTLHDDHILEVEQKLRRTHWLLKSNYLDGASKYHLFQSLFRSRFSYAQNILVEMDSKMKESIKKVWYRHLKVLLNIKEQVNREKLFQLCLG